MSAKDWFSKERLRIEKLVYMTVPETGNSQVEYLFRARDAEHEQALMNGMSEDSDHDYVDSERDSETDDSSDAASIDGSIESDEVKDLTSDHAALLIPPMDHKAGSSKEAGEPTESRPNLHPTPYREDYDDETPEVAVRDPSISQPHTTSTNTSHSTRQSSRCTQDTAGSQTDGIARHASKSLSHGRRNNSKFVAKLDWRMLSRIGLMMLLSGRR